MEGVRDRLPTRRQELESVLKGRLHQAVSLAQLGEADRWPKIKGLAEDVLQQLGGRNEGVATSRYNLPGKAEDFCRFRYCTSIGGFKFSCCEWKGVMLRRGVSKNSNHHRECKVLFSTSWLGGCFPIPGLHH